MLDAIKNILFSTELPVRERFFQLTGVIGTFATFIVMVINVVTGQPLIVVGGLAAAFLLFIGITALMLRTKRYLLIGTIAIFICNVVILPFGYLTGGGVFSGSPIWMLIYYIMTFMMFDGKLLFFYVSLTTASVLITTYVSAVHPEFVTPLIGQNAVYYDSMLSVVAVGLIFGAVIKLQTYLMQREKRLAEEQREEIEKLNQAQNTFFSSMSHEIRTPINTIIGLNEMTLRERDLPDDVVENAQNIQNASKMLLSLINDILDLSKIESGRMEVVEGQYEVSRMLSEIVNLLWNRAREKGLRFDVNIGNTIPSMLFGDEMRIKQIIVNLLTNAIKYTTEGRVILSVDGERTAQNEFRLSIDVEDTGIGIRKESIPYLFKSFKRVDEQDTRHIEGTGLGLSIAKQLVDLMRGQITVDSIYTKGTTFHVEIPQRIVNDEPISVNNIAEVTRESARYQQSFEAPEARVLIVDDNEMNRVVAGKLLRDTLVQVDLAESGAQCLEKTQHTRYDVIFMDHEMPEMDGVRAMNLVRRQTNGLCRETPMVALTANAGSDMNAFYLKQGFQAYLAKPIHSSLLEATLLQLLPPELIERTAQPREEETFFVGQTRHKRNVLITADCVCDLPEALAVEYNIRLMPYYVITKEGRFRDMSEIDADNLLRHMQDDDAEISTEPSTVEEYEAFFGAALAEADHVVHISVMSSVSEGYDRALRASASFDNVHVVDSGLISGGMGLMALQASRMAMSGALHEEIIEAMQSYPQRVSSSFIVPEPRRMARRYQLSPAIKFFTNVLNFEPVFCIKKGKIRLRSFHMGYVGNTAEQYIRRTFQIEKNVNPTLLIMTYAGCTAAEREAALAIIKETTSFDRIVVQKASATLSSHAGLHSIGLYFQLKAG